MSWIGPVISPTSLLMRTLDTKTVRLMKSSLRERSSREFSFLQFKSITGYYKSTLLPFLPFSILPPPSILIPADMSICKNNTEISPSPPPLFCMCLCVAVGCIPYGPKHSRHLLYPWTTHPAQRMPFYVHVWMLGIHVCLVMCRRMYIHMCMET